MGAEQFDKDNVKMHQSMNGKGVAGVRSARTPPIMIVFWHSHIEISQHYSCKFNFCNVT